MSLGSSSRFHTSSGTPHAVRGDWVGEGVGANVALAVQIDNRAVSVELSAPVCEYSASVEAPPCMREGVNQWLDRPSTPERWQGRVGGVAIMIKMQIELARGGSDLSRLQHVLGLKSNWLSSGRFCW